MYMISILVLIVKIILAILMAGFTLLLFVLLLILLAPILYSLTISIKEKVGFSAEIRWTLFHVAVQYLARKTTFRFSVLGKLVKTGPITGKGKEKPKQMASKKRLQGLSRAFFSDVIEFVKDTIHICRPKVFTASGSYGLDDPADTAIVSMVIQCLKALLPRAAIRLDPIFDTETTSSETTHVEIHMVGRIFLILLVGVLLKYLVKKEVRAVLFHKNSVVKTTA